METRAQKHVRRTLECVQVRVPFAAAASAREEKRKKQEHDDCVPDSSSISSVGPTFLLLSVARVCVRFCSFRPRATPVPLQAAAKGMRSMWSAPEMLPALPPPPPPPFWHAPICTRFARLHRGPCDQNGMECARVCVSNARSHPYWLLVWCGWLPNDWRCCVLLALSLAHKHTFPNHTVICSTSPPTQCKRVEMVVGAADQEQPDHSRCARMCVCVC